MWIYNGKEFDPTDEDIKDFMGFVYLITNNLTGKMYIGKKLLWTPKYKMVKRKDKTKPSKRTRYLAQSDFREYWSSSNELLKDVETLGSQNFTREVLHLCPSKGTLSYMELREQMDRKVIESDDYYNGILQVRIHKSHIKDIDKILMKKDKDK